MPSMESFRLYPQCLAVGSFTIEIGFMRKVTEIVCASFEARVKKSVGNTRTDGETLYLHDNAIAQWREDGLYITNAGWPTVTTKERLNGLKGVSISQAKSRWYLNGEQWNGAWVKVDGFKSNVPQSEDEKIQRMKKAIATYSKRYTKPYPMPSGGDCWFCAFTDTKDNKKSMGDLSQNHEHLLEHLGIAHDDSEVYVHGSMIVNAMREAGYRDEQIGFHLHGMGSEDTIPRAIRKYLTKRLIPSIAAR